jgi:exopolysaccharide transport family protein
MQDAADRSNGPSWIPGPTDVLRVLRRRFRLLIAATLLAAGLAALVSLLMTPRFEAVATVLIDSREKTVVDIDQVVSGLSADTPTIESEVELIRSSAIAGRVIADLKLGEDPEFIRSDRLLHRLLRLVQGAPVEEEISAAALVEATASSETGGDELIQAFQKRLTVQRVRNTFLISIGFQSKDAVKAARIANAIAEAYVQDQVEAKLKAAEVATTWLDKRIVELREQVFDAERMVEDYKSKNRLVNSEGFLLGEKEIARATEQLILSRTATAEARAKFEQAEAVLRAGDPADSVTDVLRNNTITLLKEQLAKTSRQVAELRTRYGELHPAMAKALAEDREAREQLRSEVAKIVANLRTEFEVARDREAEIALQIETMKATSGQSGQAMVKLNELEREANASRSIYEAFLKRAQETTQQQNLQLADARVVERATAPAEPASPKRLQIILLGMLAGLAGSLGLALAWEMLFPSTVRPEAIEAALSLDYLSAVPALAGNPRQPVDALGAIRRILIEPSSSFAEAIRSVRLGIDARRRHDGAQLILLASALPNEGKTLIASNLAHHYALSGARTVLVDADLRKGELSRLLLPAPARGLADCMVDGAPVATAIVRDAVTGMNFLPAFGAAPVRVPPAELLSSSAFDTVISELKSRFDIIVVDCPPVMPVVDARIIAEFADAIVFVVRWQATSQQIARRALRLLAPNAERIAGVVVNGVGPEAMEEVADGYVPARPAAELRRAA